MDLQHALEIAYRWKCVCGCPLTCDVCREILEGFIRDEVSWGNFWSHGTIHQPLPVAPIADDGRRAAREPQYEDDPAPFDVVRLMESPAGYRLIRGWAMRYDEDR